MLEPDYHIIKFFTENILAIEMRKSQIKTLMCEFCYGYVKPKYSEKAKLCYMDTYNLILYIKQIKFVKTLQKMFKQGLILQIMNKTIHYLKDEIKK